jgi:DNA-binding CsgD family transcriptional regulator
VSANGLYLLVAVLVYHVVGGLYYEVTLPQFARLESLAAWDRYYRIVPYIAGLPIAVRIRSRFGLPVLALLAVVTMGASYAVLPLLPPVSAYFLSFTLIQIAFAFSDLSLWVGLADYASAAPKRLSPYLIYSAGLCANLVGLTAGGMVASRFLPQAGTGAMVGSALLVTLALFVAVYNLAMAQGSFAARQKRPPASSGEQAGRNTPRLRLPPEISRQLTAREIQVAELLLKGLSNQEIEHTLHIAPGTLKTHTSHIYAKLGVGGRQKLLLLALGDDNPTTSSPN